MMVNTVLIPTHGFGQAAEVHQRWTRDVLPKARTPYDVLVDRGYGCSAMLAFNVAEGGRLRALSDSVRGLGQLQLTMDPEALEFLTDICDGDARRALSALEIGALSVHDEPGSPEIDLGTAQESIQKKAIRYDDDVHYDAASALIKSMRGSDPDAAVYWLGRML